MKLIKINANDDFWSTKHKFIESLKETYPEVDFGYDCMLQLIDTAAVLGDQLAYLLAKDPNNIAILKNYTQKHYDNIDS
jgi:hypothetical protein